LPGRETTAGQNLPKGDLSRIRGSPDLYAVQPIHEAQLLTYLKLTGLKVGLLINFDMPILKEGIKGMAN